MTHTLKANISFILLLTFVNHCSAYNLNWNEKGIQDPIDTFRNVYGKAGDSVLAELEIYGKIYYLNVSPGGGIWMTSNKSGCYYAKNYDSAWEYVFPNETQKGDFGEFVNVLSFDSTRAIIHGYLHNNTRKMIYRTMNRKDWDTVIIDETASAYGWAYGGFCNSTGEAWLGTTDNKLLYSSDYGSNWKKLKLSQTKGIEISNIYMATSKFGVAASAEDNDIILTNDNFNSCITIPSPKDQGLTESARIEKIAIYNNYIFLRNFEHTFYTHKDKIQWKMMRNPACLDFGIDRKTNELYLISTDWRIYKSIDPNKLIEIHTSLPTKPVDIKIINRAIYILDEFFYIYRLTDRRERQYPLTSAHKIRNFTGIDISMNKWVAVSKNAIYESKNAGIDWKRIGGDYFTQYSLPNNKRNAIAANPQIDGLEYSKIFPSDSNRFLILAQQHADQLQQTHSNCIIFDHSEFKEIKAFEGLYVSEIYERSSYYLATAHNDSDSYVYTSNDLINWKQLLKWKYSRINNIFIDEFENAYVLNRSGEIKFIQHVTEKLPSVTDLLKVADSAKVYPEGYYSSAFYFINKKEGYSYSSGLTSHSDQGFKTIDCGKTWTAINPRTLPYKQYYKLDSISYYSDNDHLYIKNGKTEIKLLSISDYYENDVSIEKFSVDRNHNVTVSLWNRSNWRRSEFIVYNKNENKWTMIK